MHKRDGLIERIVGDNREDRAENFGLHDIHVGSDARKDGCGRVSRIRVAEFRPADDGCRAFRDGIVQQGLVAFDGVRLHDTHEVLALLAGFVRVAVHLLYVVCNCGCQFSHEAARAKHVVWRNAGLACVQALAPGDFPCGICNFHAIEDDCWGLAAKFERDSGVDLRGAFRDVRANLRATRKEHVVEG